MHVLLLPKWYPGRKDPQLGDFIRKQALAAGRFVRMSVLHIEALDHCPPQERMSVRTDDGAWELTVRYRASRAPIAPWRKAVNLVRYWRASLAGWHRVQAERGRPDLLHAYILIRPALFAWWRSKRDGLPYIVSEQSSEYLDGSYARKGALVHAICRKLAHDARLVTAVSDWLGEGLRRHGLCTTFAVVPNVVPGLDRPLPPAGETGRYMMVADMVDKTKNVSGVLRALDRVARHGSRATLTLIGDGPDRQRLQELAAALGLAGRVRFLGRLPNSKVLDHMADAFAVVVNSNVETFSVVTGEALAQGKPVIATRCGGPQAFVEASNGLLIAPQADDELAEAMLRLMRDAARYEPARIRRTVQERFSPEAVGQAFQAIYQQALRHAR